MGYARSRPLGHWVDYPTTTYGTVGATEFENWDAAIYDLKTRVYNAADYGLGDGSTTDVVAIQAAYTAAAGARVFIPRGTWNLGTTRITGSYVPRFIGDGCEATVLQYSAAVNTGPFFFSGSLGSTVALTVNAAVGDSTLTISSTTGLAAGDYLLLKSSAAWSASEAGLQGEYVRVKSVDSGTVLTIWGNLYDSYTTANTSTVAKASLLVGPQFEGLGFVNLDTATNGSSCVNLRYCRGLKVDNLSFNSVVGSNLFLDSVIDFNVHDVSFVDGSSSGSLSFGYGVHANGSTCDGVVSDCRSRGGGHGAIFTTNGATSGVNGGVPRNIVVGDCVSQFGGEMPFHTHYCGEYITFNNCRVGGQGQAGAAQTYGPAFLIAGTRITINNPVVANVQGNGIVLAGVDCTLNSPDIRYCRNGNVSSGPSRGYGVNLAGVNNKLLGGYIAGCDYYGVNVSGTGGRMKGTYVVAGGTAGSKYGVGFNDSTDSQRIDNVTVEGADEAYHFDSGAPVTPSATIRNYIQVSCTAITNKSSGLVSPSGVENGQAGICAPSGRGWAYGNYACVANEGSVVRFVPSRDIAMIKIAFVVTVAAGSNDNCDVGVYSSAGSKIASAGSTAGKLNGTGIQTITVSGTFLAGVTYFAAFACSTIGTTAATIQGANFTSASNSIPFGFTAGTAECASMAAAFPLPSTFTLSTPVNTRPVLYIREA